MKPNPFTTLMFSCQFAFDIFLGGIIITADYILTILICFLKANIKQK